MKLSQFDFELPKEKIATELMPIVNDKIQWRDECKLMVLHKDSGEIEHRLFKDVLEYFNKGDRMVFNDTKVFPAKLYGKKEKTGADIMVSCLRFSMWSDRESNPDLIFRRDLFYPLNYQTSLWT